MTKPALVPAFILTLILPLSAIAADSYTLTTYYPAPNGKYNALSANNFTSNTAATFNGAVTMNTPLTVPSLTVNAGATVGTTLGVTGATALSSTLTTSGLANLNGGIDVMSTTHVFKVDKTQGDTETSGNLIVRGTTQLGDAEADMVTIPGTITGNTTLTDGDLTISRTVNTADAQIVLKNSDDDQYTIGVNKDTNLLKILSGGTASISMTPTAIGLQGPSTVSGTLKVTDDSIFDLDAFFGNDFLNTGNVMVGNNLTVGNTLTLEGILLKKDKVTVVDDPGPPVVISHEVDVLKVDGFALEAEALFSVSDERLKKNITPITDAVAKVKALNGVSFELRATPGHRIGLIAQNVEKTVPEVVRTGGNGMKSVEYSNLVGLLIEAIKEQQSEIEVLQKALQELKQNPAASSGP